MEIGWIYWFQAKSHQTEILERERGAILLLGLKKSDQNIRPNILWREKTTTENIYMDTESGLDRMGLFILYTIDGE